MAQIRYQQHADPALIRARRVAVIGYGSQGHAHALNLRESGVDVRVGLPPGSRSRARAEAEGLRVTSVGEAAREGEVVVVLAPDTAQPAIFEEHLRPALRPGKMLLFAHGFNIRFGAIRPPASVDVCLVAPKGPGHRVRETFREGGGVPALLAVEQDASGQADALALSYAHGIGATRAGVITTSFAEETETDLFGEQAVLCGGVSALVKGGFETLVRAGYQPEVAYFECVHELKLIVDLIYRGGLSYMRYSISDTAEYGDYQAGPRVIDGRVRAEMQRLLAEIQDGSFARRWMAEHQAGAPRFREARLSEREQPVERVGAALRELMPFVSPVAVPE